MKNSYKYLLSVSLILCLYACKLEEIVDPNNPSIEGITQNATIQQLNLLAKGVEAQVRDGYDVYLTATGSVARELWLFDSDPRNTTDLLGKNGTPIDNNTFYLTGFYNNAYRSIKNANILLEALENTTLASNQQKEGYRGFAKTMKAHQLLLALNMLGTNGIRVDVSDPSNLGPYLTQENAWAAIVTLLNEASTNLDNAGASFPFTLSAGYTGFDTPTTFKQFNRAILARVYVYQKNWAGVLNALSASFYNPTGDLNVGPQYIFSTSAGDILNPIFYPANGGAGIMVHPSWINGAESGDTRIAAKARQRTASFTQDNLTATHEAIVASNIAPISIIRNEELILMAAEANIQTNQLATATNLINTIRNAANLSNYSGAITQGALIDELLKQRFYSLFLEGHRMVDLRRYDRLKTPFVPLDRTGDVIYTQFPRPLNDEN